MKIINLTILCVYYIYKVAQSGYSVGLRVLKGYKGENGCIVKYQCNELTTYQVILLFNLLSMTPGSMSIGLDEATQEIELHLIDGNDKEAFFSDAQTFERMIKKSI